VLRFVLGADGAQREGAAIVPGPGLDQLLRVGPDGEVGRTRRAGGAQAHPCVEGHAAFVVDDKGVDVQLGDLRHIGQQLRDGQQRARDGAPVGGRYIAVAVQ